MSSRGMSVVSKLPARAAQMSKREMHILPVVLRIRQQIEEVFARYVGPISAELCREEFEHWRAEGQVGPRAMHRYIARLATYLTAAKEREAFIAEASRCIQVTGSAK